jgi:hypothetical protein
MMDGSSETITKLPFPPYGGRQRRLSEQSDPRVDRARGRMGGRALPRAHRRRRGSAKILRGEIPRCNTPHPILPPQGGKEQSEWVVAVPENTETIRLLLRRRGLQRQGVQLVAHAAA